MKAQCGGFERPRTGFVQSERVQTASVYESERKSARGDDNIAERVRPAEIFGRTFVRGPISCSDEVRCAPRRRALDVFCVPLRHDIARHATRPLTACNSSRWMSG